MKRGPESRQKASVPTVPRRKLWRVGLTGAACLLSLWVCWGSAGGTARYDDYVKVNHVIIVMQENRSFDNYFGVLGYAAGGPYHSPLAGRRCAGHDHRCVNGLSCSRDAQGDYSCQNSNPESDGSLPVFSFHDSNYCPADLNHDWFPSHQEANYQDPNQSYSSASNDGFVIVNNASEQHDTMGFYNEDDLPYYYALAETFAIDDNYFCDALAETAPNRMYLMAATSFGHLSTAEFSGPSGGYKPITGTIFDLLDSAGVSWIDYFSDIPQASEFRTPVPAHFQPIANFFAEAAAGTLPAVAFVDPQLASQSPLADDEHPPHDIRAGQFHVAQVVSAVRNGPNWKDSIIFLTYDENGGFYDHVPPGSTPKRRINGGALTPDGVAPGQCEDLSDPPASEQPGGGANCAQSVVQASELCSEFKPTGAYPTECANFNQFGFRVPLIAISPFSKPHYVSHQFGSHTSILAFIEKRFLGGQHLTARDANATTLADLFDFRAAPSMHAAVPASLARPPDPATDGNGSCLNPPPY